MFAVLSRNMIQEEVSTGQSLSGVTDEVVRHVVLTQRTLLWEGHVCTAERKVRVRNLAHVR
jgi:hypothetical protein